MSRLKEQFYQLLKTRKPLDAWSRGNKSTKNSEEGLSSKVVNLILEQAIIERASDIHIEPFNADIRIRYRVDGELYEALTINPSEDLNIIPRLKILTGLELDAIAKKRSQDGRFNVAFGASTYDFRVSTFPTVDGEKIVIRILDEGSRSQSLLNLGLNPQEQKMIERMLKLKSGLILVCGPTGSGKTTTLYAMLNQLNNIGKNIVTLEDPVEYKINGLNQCDINKRSEFTFADGLRAVLRQDPDIILVGEIRDKESGDIATRAAITGHLVLSSLHTNSAIGTILRLINMGVEPTLVSYAMIGAIAQRLVRKICDECKQPIPLSMAQLDKIKELYGNDIGLLIARHAQPSSTGIQYMDAESSSTAKADIVLYQGKGCVHCNGTGYKGRIGVFEIVYFHQNFREAVQQKATSSKLQELAIANGTTLLAHDGLQKVQAGLTTLDEILPLLIENL